MDLFERKKIEFICEDERGRLVQLVKRGYCQINVLESKCGVKRGGHFHKISQEAFFVVSGTVEVILKRDGKEVMQRFDKGDFFQIPPYTIHSMFFLTDCVLIAMYDTAIELEDGTKDIYVEESG